MSTCARNVMLKVQVQSSKWLHVIHQVIIIINHINIVCLIHPFDLLIMPVQFSMQTCSHASCCNFLDKLQNLLLVLKLSKQNTKHTMRFVCSGKGEGCASNYSTNDQSHLSRHQRTCGREQHGGVRTNSGGPRANSGGPRANSGGARYNSGPKDKEEFM